MMPIILSAEINLEGAMGLWMEAQQFYSNFLGGSPRPLGGRQEANFVNQLTLALLPDVGSAVEAIFDRAQELHERLPQEPFSHTGTSKLSTFGFPLTVSSRWISSVLG